MKLKLRIWRQANAKSKGALIDYTVEHISESMSFLEMLDLLNEQLIAKGEVPVAYDSDCREGICGSCGFMVRGVAHGPESGTTVCQLFMRKFKDGETITIEPWRAKAFPVIKDLIIDRGAFDNIIAAGGYVSVNTGSAPDGNTIPVPKIIADQAMDAAACIGCGACVAACKNASAALFVGAKVTQMSILPQGQAEREQRVIRMVDQMEVEGFGGCSNEGECEAVCPKEISTKHISTLIREYNRAIIKSM